MTVLESPGPRSAYPDLPSGILDGVRVVDLTHLWSGPLCTRILVDLGADVVKVEAAERPDGLRLVESDGHRVPSFDRVNWGKRLMALNLRVEAARRVLADLIASSAVVVDNYTPRVMDNWGLGWEAVSSWSHPLLWVAMPAYSSAGRYRSYGARGSGLEAVTGMAAPDWEGERPHFHPYPVTDPLAGWHGALAVVAGLREVVATGKSLKIEVAQSEVALQLAAMAQMSEADRGLAADPFRGPDDVSPPYEGPARAVGADTARVLRDLGYDDSEIGRLANMGAVYMARDDDGF